jgi:hypothetical protein
MKLKKTIRRLDDALYQLQHLKHVLQAVEKPPLAREVAGIMEMPLDELFSVLESLESLKSKAG